MGDADGNKTILACNQNGASLTDSTCTTHEEGAMQLRNDINQYLRMNAVALADRILRSYPPLHGV